jgi:glycosyltransferase involved in cell wall biosynthesis
MEDTEQKQNESYLRQIHRNHTIDLWITFNSYTLSMRVALVHELLTMRGGAERVLRIFAEMFPNAPIYTLLYDEKKLGEWFPKERVRTPDIRHSIFDILPRHLRFNHHLRLSQFPQAVESWDFSNYDIVISSSSAFAHGIITNGNPKHLCYVHSPARYLWDRTFDVQEQAKKGPLGFLKKKYLSHLFHRLRVWDAEIADRPDTLLAPSKEVQRRIELYWRRESDIVHPPIEPFWFDSGERLAVSGEQGYYLVVSTLVPYKKIERAIDACNALNAPLKIVGEGSYRKKLEHMSGSTVEFLGYKDHHELKDLYTNAKALILPGEEDFGLVPVEAMACGTPVIAYRKGGVLETVKEGEMGTFFDESLADVLQHLDPQTFDPQTCRTHAQTFSRKQFEEKIHKALASLI